MRLLLAGLLSAICYAQQPILYNRGALNAASFAPFGLPNGAIARGSVFTVFGENLGPSQSPALSFPLSSTLGGVSISVTQHGAATQAFPIYVSAGQINAVMPSNVATGLASLRLTYQSKKSNVVTIQIANSSPGIFAVSNGGYGPGVVYNYISANSQPINSLAAPAAPGQTVTIWGTGLGPVNFPDNVAPTPGNVATPVSVTIGGQSAKVSYSGRSPCCSGVDQIVATIPANVALGCWVPVLVNAGGTVSNSTTMAIAAQGATSCGDPGNPLSTLVLTPGTQAFIHIGRSDKIDNVNFGTQLEKEILDRFYSRYFKRPNSSFNFDPYMSLPPAGTCLVQQTSGDIARGALLRGVQPASASLAQPNQKYYDGTYSFLISPAGSDYSTNLGAILSGQPVGMNLMGANASYTIDPGGPNQMVFPLTLPTPPSWARPNGLIEIPRRTPLDLSFTPGDPTAPTVVMINDYAASVNSTVQVECVAPPGATSFTISSDTLANLPPSYRIADGSYANLYIGALGVNHAATFHNAIVSVGILMLSSWVGQTAVIQ